MNPPLASSSETPSTPRRKRLAALALLAFMFLLGIVAGVGGGALILRHRLQQRLFSLSNVSGPADLFMDRLEKEIDSGMKLSADEQAVVKAELNVTRGQIQGIRQRTVTDLRSTARETLDRIKAKLPEEKRDELEAKARERLAPWSLLQDK